MKEIFSGNTAYDAWMMIRKTGIVVGRVRERELRLYGISSVMAGVLLIVQVLGSDATPSEIARQLSREPNTVSALLNRMRKSGLIKKVKDLDKKNMVRVELTDKGYEAYLKSIGNKSTISIMSVLSEDELNKMMSYLNTIRTNAIKKLKGDHNSF